MALQVGDWVRFKSAYRGCRDGRISKILGDDLCEVDVDAAPGVLCVRADFVKAHVQQKPHEWFPMRKTMPYGHYVCADGSQVAHNRDYEPLFRIAADGTVSRCRPDEWIEHTQQTYVYSSGDEPWVDEASFHVARQAVPDEFQPSH